MIKKENSQYKNFKRKGFKPEDKVNVDDVRTECFTAVNVAEERYLVNLGYKLNDLQTGKEAYWKVIKKLLNKCHIPKIMYSTADLLIVNHTPLIQINHMDRTIFSLE